MNSEQKDFKALVKKIAKLTKALEKAENTQAKAAKAETVKKHLPKRRRQAKLKFN